MGVLDDMANVILNSKSGLQLPTAANALDTDWFYFYNNATSRTEKILKSSLVGNQSINAEFLGTPTSAGATTTNLEIEDHLNAIGFVIGFNEIKVLKLLVFISDIVYIKQYFYKPNLADTYGTGNTVIAFSDLLEIESKLFEHALEVVTTIALGDIAPDVTIEDYINANNDPSWNLLGGVIYIFTMTESGTDYFYLYVGAQPQLIGQGNNAVTAADFFDLVTSYGMLWIEDCFVRKASGNVDTTLIEVNDEVHFKKITNAGGPLMLLGQTYVGGDKQIRTSYVQNNAIDI